MAGAIDGQVLTFSITDTKLYIPAVTLSTQENVKLLQQLKSDFKRVIKWNKCQSKDTMHTRNHCLDYLINQVFRE